MKLIHTFAAVIALSFISAPLARAQETETPTEKPSASPAEAVESASPAESAVPPMPAAPAAEKSPTAKSEKAKASPAAKPSPAGNVSAAAKASPAPNAAQKPAPKGSVESQLKELENTYEAAVQNHNVAAVEAMMADDFVVTNSKGKVMNRRAALAEFKKDTDTYTSTKNLKMVVRMAAKNVAIVTGSSREMGKDKAGKPFDRTYLWTDTFVDRNGKWMVVATHVTLVASK